MGSTLFRFFVLSTLAVGALSVDWNKLRVHFGLNPFSSKNFVAMPRTESEAADAGMKLDVKCSASNGFLGRRYVSTDGDRSVMLLFDSQGTIAGIQTAIPKKTGYPSAANKKFHNVFVESGEEHLLTAYFVDPAIICNKGRSPKSLDSEGTGDRLGFQVGRPSSTAGVQVINIPRTESELQKTTKWTKGRCFIMMGQHYWYNMRPDMDCNDFFPAFLLYNSGKLDGFGFAMMRNYEGKHYEHPTVSVAKKFFPFIPKCMHAKGFPQTFSTVHIYLYKRPWLKWCIF